MPTVGIYFDDETYSQIEDRDDRSSYIQDLIKQDAENDGDAA